ncbi:MAG: GNAT family N-acetyltransferase [bacterium]
MRVAPLLRRAVADEIPALQALITASARGLAGDDYSPAQIEAALGSAWGVDSELIRDQTYFVAELDGCMAGCGGWSFRATLFGADAQAGRSSARLDAAVDAARIRAFFVRPDWARRGVGRALLEHCEAAARVHGFRAAQLMATLPGVRLYQRFGYVAAAPQDHPLPGGLRIPFVPMHKAPL